VTVQLLFGTSVAFRFIAWAVVAQPLYLAAVAHPISHRRAAAALVEAAWLAKSLVEGRTPGRLVAVAIAAPFWISAAYLLLGVIRRRIDDVPKFWKKRED